MSIKRWAKTYMNEKQCSKCQGQRLKRESLNFKIDNYTISDLSHLDISELYSYISTIETKLDSQKKAIGQEIIKELKTRLKFLIDVRIKLFKPKQKLQIFIWRRSTKNSTSNTNRYSTCWCLVYIR